MIEYNDIIISILMVILLFIIFHRLEKWKNKGY